MRHSNSVSFGRIQKLFGPVCGEWRALQTHLRVHPARSKTPVASHEKQEKYPKKRGLGVFQELERVQIGLRRLRTLRWSCRAPHGLSGKKKISRIGAELAELEFLQCDPPTQKKKKKKKTQKLEFRPRPFRGALETLPGVGNRF